VPDTRWTALASSAIASTFLVGGCSVILGDWSLGAVGDGGPGDVTADQANGVESGADCAEATPDAGETGTDAADGGPDATDAHAEASTCTGSPCLVTIAFDMAVYGGATASVSTNPPSAIACSGPCSKSAQLVAGTSVTLSVTTSGNDLVGWTGACAGSGATCTFVPTADAPLHLVVSQANFAFVTSTTTDASFGGVSAADALCQAAAASAGLPPDGYQALVVTSGMPNLTARLTAAGARGWVRVDGQPFADQIADLTSGVVRTPLWVTEKGDTVLGGVWTGANPDGTPSGTDCSGFTSASATAIGSFGMDFALGGSWNGAGTTGCLNAGHLYCFGTSLSHSLTYTKTPGRIAFLPKAPFDTSKGLSGGSPPSTTGSADVLCQTESNAAGLPGTFLALLPTILASAASRFDTTGPTWVRPDGIPLAATAALFMQGSMLTALTQYADGSFEPVSPPDGYARTGAFADPDPNAPANALLVPASSPADTCKDWTSGAATDTGSVGLRDMAQLEFFAFRGGSVGNGSGFPVACGATLPIFCLQK